MKKEEVLKHVSDKNGIKMLQDAFKNYYAIVDIYNKRGEDVKCCLFPFRRFFCSVDDPKFREYGTGRNYAHRNYNGKSSISGKENFVAKKYIPELGNIIVSGRLKPEYVKELSVAALNEITYYSYPDEIWEIMEWFFVDLKGFPYKIEDGNIEKITGYPFLDSRGLRRFYDDNYICVLPNVTMSGQFLDIGGDIKGFFSSRNRAIRKALKPSKAIKKLLDYRLSSEFLEENKASIFERFKKTKAGERFESDRIILGYIRVIDGKVLIHLLKTIVKGKDLQMSEIAIGSAIKSNIKFLGFEDESPYQFSLLNHARLPYVFERNGDDKLLTNIILRSATAVYGKKGREVEDFASLGQLKKIILNHSKIEKVASLKDNKYVMIAAKTKDALHEGNTLEETTGFNKKQLEILEDAVKRIKKIRGICKSASAKKTRIKDLMERLWFLDKKILDAIGEKLKEFNSPFDGLEAIAIGRCFSLLMPEHLYSEKRMHFLSAVPDIRRTDERSFRLLTTIFANYTASFAFKDKDWSQKDVVDAAKSFYAISCHVKKKLMLQNREFYSSGMNGKDWAIEGIAKIFREPLKTVSNPDPMLSLRFFSELLDEEMFFEILMKSNTSLMRNDAPELVGLYADYLKQIMTLRKEGARDHGLKVYLNPKDVERVHDYTTLLVDKISFEQYEDQYKIRKEKVQHLAYTGEKFSVIIPEDLHAIAQEGLCLKHCVRVYIEDVATGKTNIVFVRKNSDPTTSYYTMEVNKNHIIQCRGFANKPIHNDEMSEDLDQFIKEYTEHIK